MTTLYAIYLSILVVVLGLIMLYDHQRDRVPLLSIRNLSLVGLIVFQYFSGILHFWTNEYSRFPIEDANSSGFIYIIVLTAFTILFLLAYRLGWPGKQLSGLIPTAKVVPKDVALLQMAVVFLFLGAGMRFVPIPYIGIIANYFGYGLLSVAAGFAGWVIIRNYLNPIYLGMGGAIFAAASAVSVVGVYGRRGLVAVAASFVWGAFYGRLRYIKLRYILAGLIIVALPGLYLVAAFTAARDQTDRRSTVQTLIRGMRSPNFRDSIPALLSGQVCAPGALFVIENYPETFEVRPLHSIYYLFIVPVPRSIWPDKPRVLSNEIATNAQIQGVNRRAITLPPGVVGYIMAEGGILALVVYAWFFGAGIRFFDSLISRSPWNPLIIMPVGAGLGQVLGLFRGDLANFAFIYVTGFFGAYATCVIIGKAFDRATGNTFFTEVPDEPGNDHDRIDRDRDEDSMLDEYAVYDTYGDQYETEHRDDAR